MTAQSLKNPDIRFPFGKNWHDFHSVLNDERIAEAEKSIRSFLGCENLSGKTFLDIGSGSGLFSLAARRLGARVYSFDYDTDSVHCTQALKSKYFANDPNWKIEQGSVLDRHYIESLGKFDVVYAWGVLHHTGKMWQALYHAQLPVAPEGMLFIGIYNDQGIISSIWKIIKKMYCSGLIGKLLMTLIFYPIFFLAGLLIDICHLKNPATRYRQHKKYRGMSLVHDWKDWLGGYPYEAATPDYIIAYFQSLSYRLQHMEYTRHGFGNNQFVFQKEPSK